MRCSPECWRSITCAAEQTPPQVFPSFSIKTTTTTTGFVIGRSSDGKVAAVGLSEWISYACSEGVPKGRRAAGSFSQSGLLLLSARAL